MSLISSILPTNWINVGKALQNPRLQLHRAFDSDRGLSTGGYDHRIVTSDFKLVGQANGGMLIGSSLSWGSPQIPESANAAQVRPLRDQAAEAK